MNLGSDFYDKENYLLISPSDFIGMKKLKSNRMKSAYIDTVATWTFEDNKHMSENMLATLIHFFTKHVEIPQKFIDKYNVKKYHISLIRRMYIDELYSDECGATLGYKRPYGNSSVIGDVFSEYIKYENDIKLPEDEDDLYDWLRETKNNKFFVNIHNETMNILDLMLNELELNSLEWCSEYINTIKKYWESTEKGKELYQKIKREKKLERILQ